MQPLLPLFLDLAGRRVLLVGGGPVAAAKLAQMLAARADVRVVSPEICEAIDQSGVPVARRGFDAADLDDVWLVVAAATPDVNARVAEAAQARRIFVNAVDDPAHASAYLSGVVRRDGVTLAISTSGTAPGLTALLREALDEVLPRDLAAWVDEAAIQRAGWRRDGVAMDRRRPLLLEALNRLYEPVHLKPDTTDDFVTGDAALGTQHPAPVTWHPAPGHPAPGTRHQSSGHVSLVGAGPGDPGLLTRSAVARLRAADLVLYDALIDRRVLKLARRAQRFFVGKRAHRHAMSQQGINAVMIRAARRGKRVVRLKGGDPFVFGRGGEEVRALLAAGVRFDIVPGVTSAIAAPALAGIPITHRGVSSAFLVVGGHEEEAFRSAVSLVVPGHVTLVVMMGVSRRRAIGRQLVERGWDPETPAAIVVDASKSTQAVWYGTLRALAAEEIDIDLDGPGTIVIGNVVNVANQKREGESGHLEKDRYVSR